MFLVDHYSSLGSKTELALFSVPPTQVAVERGFNDEIQLANSCNSEGPWEFRIPPDVNFIDARHNYIALVLKIVREDGSSIAPIDGNAPAHDLVGPINLLGKTFFRNVRVFISGRQVYDSNNLYAYRAFLETELNHGWDAKHSHLESSGYEEDKPGAKTDSPRDNTGLKTRAKSYEKSVAVELVAPIHCDLFMQEKFLLSHMDIRVELTRNSDSFCLMTDVTSPSFKIQVESMKWVVRKVDISPSLSLGIETILKNGPAKYPIRRVQMTSLHLDAGRRSTPINSIFSGQIPRRILVVLVDSDSFHGSYNKSPFNFKHYKLTEAKITAGGNSYPNYPLKVDFTNGHFYKCRCNR